MVLNGYISCQIHVIFGVRLSIPERRDENKTALKKSHLKNISDGLIIKYTKKVQI